MEELRIYPHDTKIEKSVLGAIINYPDSLYSVMDIITPEVFFDSDHKSIYESMIEMLQKNKRCDLISVTNELKNVGKFNSTINELYLNDLTTGVYTSVHTIQHCQILIQLHIKRKLIVTANEILTQSYDASTDIDDLIDFAQKTIFENTVEEIKSEPEHIGDIAVKSCDQIEKMQSSGESVGVASGFNGIRFYNTDLTIIGARPSMGKTFVGCVKFGFEAAITGVPVLIFSLEMSKAQIVNRFISLQTGIDSEDLRTGKVKPGDWNKLEQAQRYFNKLPIYIDDNAGLSVWQIVAKTRKMKVRKQIGLVIIDYIGLVSGIQKNVNTKDQEIGVISRTLKKLAKDLDIPVIALSQLSRNLEGRKDKKPMLSDLRESGNIEQDADVVMFLHRDFYYTDNPSDAGTGEILIRKYRNGKLDNINFYHTHNWSKIESNPISDAYVFTKIQDNSDIPINNEFEKENPF